MLTVHSAEASGFDKSKHYRKIILGRNHMLYQVMVRNFKYRKALKIVQNFALILSES